MTFPSNAHTHSRWCDGADVIPAMVEAARALGFVSLGFSGQIFIADNDFLPAHNQFEMIVGTQEQSFARKMVLVIGTHLLTAGLYFVNTV